VVKAPSPEPTAAQAPALSVGVAAVLEGIVQVKGRTDPGASVTVDGHEVKVLPDGSFSEFVKQTETAPVVVRATDASGLFTEQKKTVSN
jgi:hypothetical protein